MIGSPKTHTLSVLVEDKPGVLARVAALFSRRGFNIESLAVGATEQKDMSRMTIVVSAEETPLEQITKQLNKLINVIKIIEQDINSHSQGHHSCRIDHILACCTPMYIACGFRVGSGNQCSKGFYQGNRQISGTRGAMSESRCID